MFKDEQWPIPGVAWAVSQQRLNSLADYIEDGGMGGPTFFWSDKFNMRNWSTCVAGCACRHFKLRNREHSRVHLGISYGEALCLFKPHEDRTHWGWDATPKQAANVLRHLAKTGEVSWTREVADAA